MSEFEDDSMRPKTYLIVSKLREARSLEGFARKHGILTRIKSIRLKDCQVGVELHQKRRNILMYLP
jgi:hypothetical protein